MNVKPIVKPEVKESFFYGDIIAWNFRNKITPAKGKYCIRFELMFSSGKNVPMQKGGFRTQKEAIAAKEFAIAELHNKEYVPFEYTVKEFYDYWLYWYMIDEKKVSYGTFTSYRNVIYKYLLKVWGNRKLITLERDDITEALNSIESKSVLNMAYGVVGGSFEYAKNHNYIRLNPAKSAIKMKRIAEKQIDMNTDNTEVEYKEEIRPVLSIEQISVLLYNCKKYFPEIYLPLMLALTTGMRISEVIGVKYTDIDYGNYELHISRQLGRTTDNQGISDELATVQELRTKTKNSVRVVPLADFVMDEIILARKKYEHFRDIRKDFHDTNYICCKDNGLPNNRSYTRNPFLKLLEKCGFPPMHWHDLRHTYATILRNDFKISTKAISSCMGHYSPDFTQKQYIAPQRQVYDCAVELESYISKVLPLNVNGKQVPLGEKTKEEIYDYTEEIQSYIDKVLPEAVEAIPGLTRRNRIGIQTYVKSLALEGNDENVVYDIEISDSYLERMLPVDAINR